MQPTNKPQAIAARAFIAALHAHKAGDISREELDTKGDDLNEAVRIHGKP